MYKKLLAGTAILLLLSWISAQVETYDLPGNEVYPEGIAYNPANATFYVSSTTDGSIIQVNAETGEASTFSPGGSDGRSSALGMTVDDQGRLWVAGSQSGRVYVYNTTTGELTHQYQTPEAEAMLLNDVITTPNGDAYITDSFRPVLFRVPADQEELSELEPWLDFRGTVLEYQEGVNLNGIEATEDGQFVLAVQMNTGSLFRIDTASQEVTEIDLGGESLPGGDGLVLNGQTLYVVYNGNPENINISVIDLSNDFSSGTLTANFSNPAIGSAAATAAQVDDRLLVVNTQFDRQQAGNPELPFTITSLPIAMLTGEQTAAGAETGGAGANRTSTGASTLKVTKHEGLVPLLTDAQGRALYLYLEDDENASDCYDRCAENWPPLLIEGQPVAGRGVNAGLLSTIERDDGTLQATFNGRPLYRYVRDANPGDIRGHGLGEVFYLVLPSGTRVETATVPESDVQVDEEAFTALMTAGENVFSNVCATCHGAEGQGQVGPRLAGNTNLDRPEFVANRIIHGFPQHGMPAFREQLSNEEVAAAATYVRNSWENDFGAVTAQMVEELLAE